MNRIAIAVSSCLLGHKVRYDGTDKYCSLVETELCKRFYCIPLCPEFAIGLGVPRDPIQVMQSGNSFQVVNKLEVPMDVTQSLQAYADFVSHTIPQICGYVFKARSPSCGLVDTPVFDKRGNKISVGQGIYAARLIERYEKLPVIDEIQLSDEVLRQNFIQRVKRFSLSLQG